MMDCKEQPIHIDDFFLDESVYSRIMRNISLLKQVECKFTMTPYYYTSGKRNTQKLQGVDRLAVTIEFGIWVYRKKNHYTKACSH